MAGLEYTAQELGTVLQAATQSSLHSSRRHVFHLVTDVASVVKLATRTEVCGAQDQLERVFLQLLQSPLKLICSPIQTTLAECYVALFEWGDCRKLPDALHNLLKIVASKADVSNRVAAVFIIGELFANHGVQLASEAVPTVTILAKQTKLVEVSTRAACVVALQRIVEGTADTDGGVRCHVAVLKTIDKVLSSDKAYTVRAACCLVAQALSTASLGHLSVKLPALLSVCNKGLNDASTPVRTAAGLALATILANSVLTSAAASDAKDKAVANARLSRMRRVDVDDSVDIGTGGGEGKGGKAHAKKKSGTQGGGSVSASPITTASSTGNGGDGGNNAKKQSDEALRRALAAAASPGIIPFTVGSALRYLASLLAKCEENAARVAVQFVASSNSTDASSSGGVVGSEEGEGYELPADHSTTAASFRATIAIAAACFLKAVRTSLSDTQLECAIRLVLTMVCGGSGGSGASQVQRRAIVLHVLEGGLVEPVTELCGRSAGQWQSWQRMVFNVLCDVLSSAAGSSGLTTPTDESGGSGEVQYSDYTGDDGLPVEAISECGIICLLTAIGDLLPKVVESGGLAIESCSTSILLCLTRQCHGVRLAAVGCLYQLCCAQSNLAASLLPSMVTTLDQAYRYLTSAEAIASTAATAAAMYAGSLTTKRDTKSSSLFSISKPKSDKAVSTPHTSSGGLGIPGSGVIGGIGVCASDDAALLHRLHGFSCAIAAVLKAVSQRVEGAQSAIVDSVQVLALAMVSRISFKGKATHAGHGPALVSAAAASEVDAACVRAGWALIQGLCCTSRQWPLTVWGQLMPVLQSQFAWQLENTRAASFQTLSSTHTSSTAVPLNDTSYSGVTDAWYWTSTASASAGLLAIVRCLAACVGGYSEACDSLALVIGTALDTLLTPVPSSVAWYGGAEKLGESGSATPPRPGGTGSGKSTATFVYDLSTVPGPVTPAQCAAYVIRRSVMQCCACVLESVSLLPLNTAPFRPTYVKVVGAALLNINGGLAGLNLPAVEAVGGMDDGSSSPTAGIVVGHLSPAFTPSAFTTGPSQTTSLLAAILGDSPVPEVSFDRSCLFGADTVLCRGMGELSDPNIPATLRNVLSATVLSALDSDFIAGLVSRTPVVALCDDDNDGSKVSAITTEQLSVLDNINKSVDHPPFMPQPGLHTASVLRGFASSGEAVNVLFPSTVVKDPRRLLPAATPHIQTFTASSRLVDASVVVLAQLVPFLAYDQAEAVVHVLTSPLKPSGTASLKGKGGSGDNGDFLSPIAGLSQALVTKITSKERIQIHRNITAAVLMLLTCLKPENVKGSDKTMIHWVLRCRAALGAGLVSQDNFVRRTSAQALGELARLGGTTFAKNLVASIQKQLQDAPTPQPQSVSGTPGPSPTPSSQPKLNLAGQAGAVFALGCVQRANVITRGRICVENVHDVVIFDAARETKQPLRTWALHTWWLLLEAAGSAFHRYVQPTLALLDAHILSATHTAVYSPSLAASADQTNSSLFCRLYRSGGLLPVQGYANRARDADDAFAVLGCSTYAAGRLAALDASVALCLARILQSLIEGLGPELERKKDWTRRCLAAWTHLCCVPDAAVAQACLNIIKHLVFVTPDMVPRPLLLCLYRSTLLGPSVVHKFSDFVTLARNSGSDLLNVAAFCCGIRRLGVRFGTETAIPGKGMSGYDAVGGGGAFGRSSITDLLMGSISTGVVSHAVPLSTLPDDVGIRVLQAAIAASSDGTSSSSSSSSQTPIAVGAGGGKFYGSGCPLAIISAAGIRSATVWLQRNIADYTSVFHHDPTLFTSSGAWCDLWLATDECLALTGSLNTNTCSPVLYSTQTTPNNSQRPLLYTCTPWSCDFTSSLDSEVEVFAMTDVGTENSSAVPLKTVSTHCTEAFLKALVDFVTSTSNVDTNVIGSVYSRSGALPTLPWLSLCSKLLTSSGSAEGGDGDLGASGPGREVDEDEGVSMGAGADMGVTVAADDDDEDTGNGKKKGGKSKGKGSGWAADFDDEDSMVDVSVGVGVPSMWRDVRWQTRTVVIGFIRLLLHDWKCAFESRGVSPGSRPANPTTERPKIPKPVLMQLHDLLTLAGNVAIATEVGEGSLSVQACGLALLADIVALFGEEPDPDVPSQSVLQQYQAQIAAVVRSHFGESTEPGLHVRTVSLIRRMILSGIANDKVSVKRLLKLVLPDESIIPSLLTPLSPSSQQWPLLHSSLPLASWCGDTTARVVWMSLLADIAVLAASAMMSESSQSNAAASRAAFSLRRQGLSKTLTSDTVSAINDTLRPYMQLFTKLWVEYTAVCSNDAVALTLLQAPGMQFPLSQWSCASVAAVLTRAFPDAHTETTSLCKLFLLCLRWLELGKFSDDSVSRVAVTVCTIMSSSTFAAVVAALGDSAPEAISNGIDLLLNVFDVVVDDHAGLTSVFGAVGSALSGPLASSPWLRGVYGIGSTLNPFSKSVLSGVFRLSSLELSTLIDDNSPAPVYDRLSSYSESALRGVLACVDRLIDMFTFVRDVQSQIKCEQALLWLFMMSSRILNQSSVSPSSSPRISSPLLTQLRDKLSKLVDGTVTAIVSSPVSSQGLQVLKGAAVDTLAVLFSGGRVEQADGLWSSSIAICNALQSATLARRQSEDAVDVDADAFSGLLEGGGIGTSASALLLSSAKSLFTTSDAAMPNRLSLLQGLLQSMQSLSDVQLSLPLSQSLLREVLPPLCSLLTTISPLTLTTPSPPTAVTVVDVVSSGVSLLGRVFVFGIIKSPPTDVNDATAIGSLLTICCKYLQQSIAPSLRLCTSHVCLLVAKAAPSQFKTYIGSVDPTTKLLVEAGVRAAVAGTVLSGEGNRVVGAVTSSSGGSTVNKPGQPSRLTLDMSRFKK